MKAIFKYVIELRMGEQPILLPVGAKILKLEWQLQYLCLWVLVNPAVEQEIRILDIIGTGINIHESDKFEALHDYIDTVKNRGMVYHVFISK